MIRLRTDLKSDYSGACSLLDLAILEFQIRCQHRSAQILLELGHEVNLTTQQLAFNQFCISDKNSTFQSHASTLLFKKRLHNPYSNLLFLAFLFIPFYVIIVHLLNLLKFLIFRLLYVTRAPMRTIYFRTNYPWIFYHQF